MDRDEKQKRFENLFMDTLRTAIDEGLIHTEEDVPVAMIAGWLIVIDTIDVEGEPGSALLHPSEQRLPEAYKLLSIGKLQIEEDLRDWIRGG